MNTEVSLSQRMTMSRADRPDEWLMDAFVMQAVLLENNNRQLEATNTELRLMLREKGL